MSLYDIREGNLPPMVVGGMAYVDGSAKHFETNAHQKGNTEEQLIELGGGVITAALQHDEKALIMALAQQKELEARYINPTAA